MEYFIIVYKNTFDAMEAEKILNGKGYTFRIMPTPTSMTQSCGICTRFEDENQVKEIMDLEVISFKNIFKRNKNGFDKIR